MKNGMLLAAIVGCGVQRLLSRLLESGEETGLTCWIVCLGVELKVAMAEG